MRNPLTSGHDTSCPHPSHFFFGVSDRLPSHQPRDTDHGSRSCAPPAPSPVPQLPVSTVLFSYPLSYHSTEIFGSRPPMLLPFITPQHSHQLGHEPRITGHRSPNTAFFCTYRTPFPLSPNISTTSSLRTEKIGRGEGGQTKLGISCLAHNPRSSRTFAKYRARPSVLSRDTDHGSRSCDVVTRLDALLGKFGKNFPVNFFACHSYGKKGGYRGVTNLQTCGRSEVRPLHKHEERFFASQAPLRMTSVALAGELQGNTHGLAARLASCVSVNRSRALRSALRDSLA